MKYLDEQIELTVSDFTISKAKTYIYEVITSDVVVFTGNVFLTSGMTSKTFNITDIVRNYNYINKFNSDSIVKDFYVKLYIDNNEYESSFESIYLTNRYPHTLKRLIPTEIRTSLALQRCLVPVYPYIDSDNIYVYYTFNSTNINNSTTKTIIVEHGGEKRTDSITTPDSLTESNKIPMSTLLAITPETMTLNTEDGISLVITDNVLGIQRTFKIGEFCDNLDGYYLQWQDRLGGIQSQHFSGHPKYSETFSTIETINSIGNKRMIHNVVSSNWEISTDWISDELYPNYESIFVSPFLILYDVKEDVSYNVVLKSSDYTEKTFHNQGNQMFNLNLTVERENNQNLIY